MLSEQLIKKMIGDWCEWLGVDRSAVCPVNSNIGLLIATGVFININSFTCTPLQIALYDLCHCQIVTFVNIFWNMGHPYVIFVFLLTSVPFPTYTKNTLIPNLLTPKCTKFKICTQKHSNSHFLTKGWRWCQGQISGMRPSSPGFPEWR